MCLIKGRENDSCGHQWCSYTAKCPQWAISKASLINKRHDFNEFKRFRSANSETPDSYWLMAVNPFPFPKEIGYKHPLFCNSSWNKFEHFRQGTSEIKTYGPFPIGRDVFSRSEIEIQWLEDEDLYPDGLDELTMQPIWKKRINVSEFYVYVEK